MRIEQGEYAKHGILSTGDHLTPPDEPERLLLRDMPLTAVSRATPASLGDLLVYLPEESRAQKQVIRKAAKVRVIDVNPAIRQVFVQVDKAQLGEHRGDWRRLHRTRWCSSGI